MFPRTTEESVMTSVWDISAGHSWRVHDLPDFLISLPTCKTFLTEMSKSILQAVVVTEYSESRILVLTGDSML